MAFQGAAGTLQLDNSSRFTGTISGFGGDGTLAGSDHIDLKDINFNSLVPSQLNANGILTVSDGAHTANLHFDGSYQLDNFKFADDGHGGTLVYDPPVSSAADGATAQSLPTPTTPSPLIMCSRASCCSIRAISTSPKSGSFRLNRKHQL